MYAPGLSARRRARALAVGRPVDGRRLARDLGRPRRAHVRRLCVIHAAVRFISLLVDGRPGRVTLFTAPRIEFQCRENRAMNMPANSTGNVDSFQSGPMY